MINVRGFSRLDEIRDAEKAMRKPYSEYGDRVAEAPQQCSSPNEKALLENFAFFFGQLVLACTIFDRLPEHADLVARIER